MSYYIQPVYHEPETCGVEHCDEDEAIRFAVMFVQENGVCEWVADFVSLDDAKMFLKIKEEE